MMRSEAIAIIKRGLGYRQTQDASIIAALKQAQHSLEHGKSLPDWLLSLYEPVAYTPSLGLVLPERFLKFKDDEGVYWTLPDNLNVKYLTRVNADELWRRMPHLESPQDTQGDPEFYILRSPTRLEFWPSPATDTTFNITYYKAAEILDTDIENAWLKYAPNYLIGTAGVLVAGDVRDRAAQEKFNLMARMGQSAHLGDIIDNELNSLPLTMGRNN